MAHDKNDYTSSEDILCHLWTNQLVFNEYFQTIMLLNEVVGANII